MSGAAPPTAPRPSPGRQLGLTPLARHPQPIPSRRLAALTVAGSVGAGFADRWSDLERAPGGGQPGPACSRRWVTATGWR